VRLILAAVLLFGGYGTAQPDSSSPTHLATGISLQFVQPNIQPDYNKQVLLPLKTAQASETASCEAAGGTLNGVTCVMPSLPPPVTNSPESPQTQGVTGGDYLGTDEPQEVGLIGHIGYSDPYGNCVDEPGVNNPGWGNPIDWPITTTTASIGASALFYFNHVAVVVGIWPNGDIEVDQENSPGAPHTYPPWMVRGYR